MHAGGRFVWRSFFGLFWAVHFRADSDVGFPDFCFCMPCLSKMRESIFSSSMFFTLL